MDYEEDRLRSVVAESQTLSEVLRAFGRNTSAASYRTLKKRLSEWEIDYAHFLSRSEHTRRMLDEGKIRSVSDEEAFCERSKVSRTTIRKRLRKNGKVPYTCAICQSDDTWNGVKITLILDHINGVRDDHRIENLRFLCPNCNATLVTHCVGWVGLLPDPPKTRRAYHRREGQRKVDRPSLETLLKEVEQIGYSATGRKYGVSDNSIRKWIRWYKCEQIE